MPINSPITPINEQTRAVRTSLYNDFGLNNDVVDLIYEWSEFYDYSDTRKAEAIVSCEGDNNPNVCNKQFGCLGGQGHFQIIPSTWLSTCAGVLGLTDVFDGNQNIRCGIYILKTRGDGAWGTVDTWWGSYKCWSKKI